MSIFIVAGGGDPEQSTIVDQFFASLLPRKKILLIPQAVAPEFWSYEKTYDWVKNREAFDEVDIEMWKNIENRRLEELKAFDAIYIMGGNTFTLLHKLRETGFIHLIKIFLDSGGFIFGLSAGAILMGQSIEIAEIGSPEDADENTVGLTDFKGLNLLHNITFYTHYRPEEDEQLFEYSQKHQTTILGIPEESALFSDGNNLKVIGTEPVVKVIKEGKMEFPPGTSIYTYAFIISYNAPELK